MSASDHANRERAELADCLDAVGPDAPTLCEGWTTRDLAAHLVVRERRPDAAIGVAGGPTAGWTERVQSTEAKNDYFEVVDKFRNGPPLFSVFALPGAAGLMNLVEYVVHHEDVIRAQPGWRTRDLPSDLSDTIWSRITMLAKRSFRDARSGVTLVRSDGSGAPIVANSGASTVTITGSALDLLLLASGRSAVNVEVDGEPAEVESVRATYLAA